MLDRGTEFANHADMTAKIPRAQFYFAYPMSPWERGTNEDTNGLLRQYVPKNTYKVPFSSDCWSSLPKSQTLALASA